LFNKFEERYWEFNKIPMRKQNLKVFANVNNHFPNDVQCIWAQCRDKFNKMKDKYNVEKKKTAIIGVLPLDWPWYGIFDCLFASTTKIVGYPKVLIKMSKLFIDNMRF